MSEFAAALTLFLAAHAVPASPRLRTRLVGLLGRGPYLAVYSLLSLALFAWLVVAVRRADTVALWAAAPWQWSVTLLVMPLALFLLVAGLIAPNPLSVSLRPGNEPGPIVEITRHPVLWGFLLWAVAHIPPNGDLTSVVLFGTMTVFAAVGMPLLDARARRRLGRARWETLGGATSVLPFAALLGGRGRAGGLWRLVLPAIAAGLLYAWFLVEGHALLIGPDPLATLRAFS